MLKRLSLIVCLLWQFQYSSANPQQAATQDSEQRKTSTPYTGDLSIFESPGRDERLQINRIMDILSIHAGTTVADIGAGSGWFTVRAARRVGDGDRNGNGEDHGVNREVVIREAEQAGYRLVQKEDFVKD